MFDITLGLLISIYAARSLSLSHARTSTSADIQRQCDILILASMHLSLVRQLRSTDPIRSAARSDVPVLAFERVAAVVVDAPASR